MKAYININQKAFIELSNLKKIKLDLIDVTIFDFVYKFSISNKAQKLLIDNHLYIWCSYQKIIDDNPLMNIASKKAIEIRLNKLVEVGLLSKFTDKKQGNKTFFNVTDLAYTLVIENTNLSNEDYQPLSNEDYYNSKLINSKLDSNKEKDKKENLAEQFIKEKNVTQQSNKDLVIDFVEYRKLIKKPLRTIAPIQQLIDNLILLKDLGYSFDYCIEQMKSNEWQTVKKEYIHKQTKPQQKSRAESNADFIREHYGVGEDGNIIDTEIM